MKPIKIEQINQDPAKLAVFNTKGGFIGWILRNSEGFLTRPANTWKPVMFETRNKAEKYLLASLKYKPTKL